MVKFTEIEKQLNNARTSSQCYRSFEINAVKKNCLPMCEI